MEKKMQKKYIEYFSKLEMSITQGDVDKLKELNVSKGNFEKCLRNVKNPFGKTNAVILACREKQLAALEYLLSSESKIIEKSSGMILPTDDDETHHNAFYYAIRSGDSKFVQMLISRWPGNYFSARNEELDEIIARAYEELKLNNVVLSNEIKCFIEKQLINLRFYAASSQQCNNIEDYIKIIKERVAIIVENFESIRENYSTTDEIDEEWLYKMKFIVQNINVLKQKLKSTYDRLPWEEIEFCLIMFISVHKNQNTSVFYNASLEYDKILSHLENFVKKLESEMKNINVSSVGELRASVKQKRSEISNDLISKCPEFESLYEDYQLIRDLCSLEKIKDTLKLGLDADVSESRVKLVITRVIQILGEYMKNTLESPKLSDATNQLLLASLPKNTRKLVLPLRDSISHIDSLFKRTEIENNKEDAFFSRILNDLKGIGSVVDDFLQARKANIFTSLLNKICNAESLKEFNKLTRIFKNNSEIDFFDKNFNKLIYDRIKDLVDECNKIIPDQTEYERQLFQQIYDEYCSVQDCMKERDLQHRIIKELLISDKNLLYNNKFMDPKLKIFDLNSKINETTKSFDVKKITEFLVNIYKSIEARSNRAFVNDVRKLIFHVLGMAARPDAKWIQDLAYKLTGNKPKKSSSKHKNTFTNEMYEKELSMKIAELECILNKSPTGAQQLLENLDIYKKDKQTQAAVEMLLLDIMSIYSALKINFGMDFLFVDMICPVLVGKCLRNHIAHHNELVSLLLDDLDRVIFLNAIKLINEKFIGNKNEHVVSVRENISSLKREHEYCLKTLNRKQLMFLACEKGSIDDLKSSFLEGADLNSRCRKGRGVLYFASKGNCIRILQFLLELNQNLCLSINELEVAVSNGSTNIVEFIVEMLGMIDNSDESEMSLLHIAAKNGHKDVVEVLIKNKYDPRKYNIDGMPIHYAAQYNHKNIVEVLLENENTIDERNTCGYSLLHIAAEFGYYKLVEYLLERRSDVNAKNYNIGLTPLHLAAEHGHLEVIKLLISKGADVNVRDLHDKSPLYYATYCNHVNIVSLLLEHGANVKAASIMSTSLRLACKKGYKDIVKLLLENGADSNVDDSSGRTPMHLAVKHGHNEIFTILLSYGSDIHAKTKHQDTLLHCAAESGQKEIVQLLINCKLEVNAENRHSITPLHVAAANGHSDIVDLLINNGAVVNLPDEKGNTPLHAAVLNNHKEVIERLIKEKAELDVTNTRGATPLCIAVYRSHIEAITLLLEHGAEAAYDPGDKSDLMPLKMAIMNGNQNIVKLIVSKLNYEDKHLWSDIIYLAVTYEHTEIVEFLITSGVDVNFNGNGSKLLAEAVVKNNMEIVKVLIEKKALASSQSADELLCKAVEFGHADMVVKFLQHGASVDGNSKNGTPLLVEAAKHGYVKIFNTLIEKCKNTNASSDKGMTALHNAVQCGHKEIVEILLKNGANVNVMCDIGTPLHFAAVFNDNPSIVELLLNSGADVNIENKWKQTAVQLAVAGNNLVTVKTLLSGGRIEHINFKGTADGSTLLHIAVQAGNMDMIRHLIDQGANIDEKDNNGSKPVHHAARKGYTEIVEFFLNKGSCVNELGYNKQTLLHYATISNQTEMVEYLISKNANLNAQTANGHTPLHYSVLLGFEAVAGVLLNNGAMYNIVDDHNTKPIDMVKQKYYCLKSINCTEVLLKDVKYDDVGNPTKERDGVVTLLRCTENLLKAVKCNDIPEVIKCIEEGAILNAKDASEDMPLHFAAVKGYLQIVEILLKFKAKPNLSIKDGSTPLHYAAKFSHINVVKLLLSNRAIYNSINNANATPLDLATEDTIIDLLKIIDELFEDVQKGGERVISEIERIKDTDTVKAIMNARNRNNKTLLMVAMLSNFPKIKEFKNISFRGISSDMTQADKLCNCEKYGEALFIYQNVLEKMQTTLGPHNFGLLDVKEKIARILYEQEKYDEALDIYSKIYALKKRFLGPEFIDTLNTRSLIAVVLQTQGKSTEALVIFNDIYDKQKKFLKPNSEEMMNTQLNMAAVLYDLKMYEEAIKMTYELYENLKARCGAKHPTTISVRNNVASILCEMGQHDKAIQIFDEDYNIMTQVLGPSDPKTLQPLHNKARVYMMKSRYEEAIKLFEEIFDIQKKALGLQHRDTMRTQFDIGRALCDKGEYFRGKGILEEYLRNAKHILGSKHPDVLCACSKVDEILSFLKVAACKDLLT